MNTPCRSAIRPGARAPDSTRAGLIAGLGAYVLWGFLPLLFHALRAVPAFELVAWRVVFTLPVCVILLAVTHGWADLATTLRRPRVVARLMLCAALIATNWLIYVSAVVHGHVLATSLGYYINPLLNVVFGTLFLRERLGTRQWVAVAIAALGIALLLAGALPMLATAVSLAASFATYGLIRKLTPVNPITGLSIETLVLWLPAMIAAMIIMHSAHGSSIVAPGWTPALLVASGLLTAVPLLLFTVAARHLPLSTLGFMQFTTPTMLFAIGVFELGEALDPVKLGCFALIWVALGLFSWDLWQRQQTAS